MYAHTAATIWWWWPGCDWWTWQQGSANSATLTGPLGCLTARQWWCSKTFSPRHPAGGVPGGVAGAGAAKGAGGPGARRRPSRAPPRRGGPPLGRPLGGAARHPGRAGAGPARGCAPPRPAPPSARHCHRLAGRLESPPASEHYDCLPGIAMHLHGCSLWEVSGQLSECLRCGWPCSACKSDLRDASVHRMLVSQAAWLTRPWLAGGDVVRSENSGFLRPSPSSFRSDGAGRPSGTALCCSAGAASCSRGARLCFACGMPAAGVRPQAASRGWRAGAARRTRRCPSRRGRRLGRSPSPTMRTTAEGPPWPPTRCGRGGARQPSPPPSASPRLRCTRGESSGTLAACSIPACQ